MSVANTGKKRNLNKRRLLSEEEIRAIAAFLIERRLDLEESINVYKSLDAASRPPQVDNYIVYCKHAIGFIDWCLDHLKRTGGKVR